MHGWGAVWGQALQAARAEAPALEVAVVRIEDLVVPSPDAAAPLAACLLRRVLRRGGDSAPPDVTPKVRSGLEERL